MTSPSMIGASVRRPGRTIGMWLVAVAVGGVIVAILLAGSLSTEMHLTGNPESTQAAVLAERVRPLSDTELFVVSSRSITIDDARFRAAVEGLQGRLTALGPDVVAAAVSWYQVGDPSLVSADRRATLVPTILAGTVNEAPDKVAALREVLAASQQPGFVIQLAGDASVAEEVGRITQGDLVRGGVAGFVVSVILLVVLMGGVVALSMPIGVNVAVAVVGLAVVALIGQATKFSALAAVAVSVLGLALAISHSAFVVSRYRQERDRGLDPPAAAEAAAESAGRILGYGGLAVCAGLAGFLLVPATVVRSIVAAAMILVVVSTLAAVTLVPALLGALGDRVDGLGLGLPAPPPGRGGLNAVARTAVSAPLVFVLLGLAVLLGASSLVAGLRGGTPSPATLPPSSESAQTFGTLAANFPTLVRPVEIVVGGDVAGAEVTGAIDRLVKAMAQDPVFGPATVAPGPGGDAAIVSVPLFADPTGAAAYDAVRRVRDDYVPAAFAGVAVPVHVGGSTAGFLDASDVAGRYMPIVVALAVLASFLVLAVALRSVFVPLVGLVLNLLVAGAAFGLTRIVFQDGVGAGVLGLQQGEQIWVWIPMLVYATFFALSVDSFVLFAATVRGRALQGATPADAAVHGVRTAAGVLAGASLVLLPLLLGMASGRGVIFQQGAFALGVALVLDAVVVRLFVLPAALTLLGRWAWDRPQWLAGLPEGAVRATPGAATTDWSQPRAGAYR